VNSISQSWNVENKPWRSHGLKESGSTKEGQRDGGARMMTPGSPGLRLNGRRTMKSIHCTNRRTTQDEDLRDQGTFKFYGSSIKVVASVRVRFHILASRSMLTSGFGAF